MFGVTKWALALTAALSAVQHAVARPTELHPGTAKDLIINFKDTINGTAGAIQHASNDGNGTGPPLKITVTNNIGNNVNCYITGSESSDSSTLTPMILQADGTWYYPDGAGSTTPQPITANIAIPLNPKGQTTDITIPGYIKSARVWFAVGNLQFFTNLDANGAPQVTQPSETNPSDPSAGVNWGFVEFNYAADSGVYANVSYVDFVGLPLGLSLTNSTGAVQTALGLPADAVPKICNDLRNQTSVDGKPWDQLCQTLNGTVIRVLSPNSMVAENSSFGLSNYFDDYVNQVWEKYSSTSLTVNTQNTPGNVTCNVSGDTLLCGGDNKNYTKPASADIFGCASGPLNVEPATDNAVRKAVVPRLCAAFNRGTYLLDGGDVQPSLGAQSYYTTKVANWYSEIVHKYEVDGKGYAFSYDDINPDNNENASGEVSSKNPSVLAITVGGPST
ncbi:hypothetical protein BGW36DRAFT_322374 [Talaromyces proteolyticus]|uniref:GH64 domain-containing protein n=1 Tax=Talaromyces proteolyticus TaxID=1131652 RepID=A0AAD4KKN9_9EURO|nr:uncharacterized protein BGW36DRAFT_322374 [Talaromyces proteolyticus]KAH8694924.1 hypothetical protein BGW36DRAFT_322374 [Talaromyces proteolyticus]